MSEYQPQPQPQPPIYPQGTYVPSPPVEAPRKRRNPWPWIVASIVVVMLLCGGAVAILVAGVDDATPEGAATRLPTTTTGGPGAATATPAAAPEEPVGDDGPSAFGRGNGWKYEDGLVVSVDKVARWRPSQYAAGAVPGGTGIKVTITVINQTGATFDCSLMDANAAYGPTGVQAERVFDEGVGGCEGNVANGRSRTVVFGFSAKAVPVPLQIGVEPSWNHEEALFEGKA